MLLYMLVISPLIATPTPRVCKPTVAQVQKAIVNYSRYDRATRKTVSRLLAPRVVIEAKRWNLSVVAMLAVASVESDFRNRYKGRGLGRRAGEVGVWQLIPNDFAMRLAERYLRGCFKVRAAHCPLGVLKVLRRPRRLRARQLADITISTWLFAYEVTKHVNTCKSRHGNGHRRRGVRLPIWLTRWGHFNSGPRLPTTWYLVKLSRRYRLFKRILCP